MLNLNDIFIGLSKNKLCLKVDPNIAGQDTNFEELMCQIKDEVGNLLLFFDYNLDHYLHGGNISPQSSLNPYGWYLQINTIEELLKHIEHEY